MKLAQEAGQQAIGNIPYLLINFVLQQMLKNVNHDEPPDQNPFKDAS